MSCELNQRLLLVGTRESYVSATASLNHHFISATFALLLKPKRFKTRRILNLRVPHMLPDKTSLL